MRQLLWILALVLVARSAQAQTPFSIEIEAEPFAGFPGLQSFAIGQYGGKWILFAGRKDGLHRRQPFAAFAPAGANAQLFIADPQQKTVQTVSLASLPTSLQEQLSATNLQYAQRGEWLYLIGGYGFSTTQTEFVTYPYLTAVNMPDLLALAAAGQPLLPAFLTLTDERLRVTGGYLHELEGNFLLVGGQNFHGRYNPMGPDHGPGFFQAYTNAIKRFDIQHVDGGLALGNYQEAVDTAHLHRRDFNLAPQRFPDGSHGLTAFSGVFRYDADLPWLDVVDISAEGYEVRTDFQQYLNQYHTALSTLYNADEERMFTLFFGGISQFFLDAEGVLVQDNNVPFVKTISLVERTSDNQLREHKVGEMPALLGAGAAFVPAEDLSVDDHGIIMMDESFEQRRLLGHVIGGIRSTASNVFFTDNTGTMSSASPQVWRVWYNPETTSAVTQPVAETYFNARVFPNPSRGKFSLHFSLPVADDVKVSLTDASGQVVDSSAWTLAAGSYEWSPAKNKPRSPGIYYLRLGGRQFAITREVVIQR